MPTVRTLRKAKTGTARVRPVSTGRDGAIDYAVKTDFLEHNQDTLDGHVYRVIEIVGTSDAGIEAAIESAIARAHKTIRNLRWFEVARTSGHIEDGKVRHFQVTLKVGFTMEAAQ